MQLSREALNSLESFRLEPFPNEESLQSAVQRVFALLLKEELGCSISVFKSRLASKATEKEPWEYGLSVLILQAAKRGFSRAELADYARQLGWMDDRINPVCDMYETNLAEFRGRMDNTVSPLPKLMGIKCSLLNREIPMDQRGCRIDFTSAVTYYRVLLIIKDTDGSESVMEKVLSSIQLNVVVAYHSHALEGAAFLEGRGGSV
ncbi:hypothetical protein BLSTO_05876 [Blastocystis sp. subtype 1]